MNYRIIGYDFEVFSKANWWMVVFIDYQSKERTIILNNKKELKEYYNSHKDDIFIGYNSRGYDQWIFKGILMGENPCKINDEMIMKGKNGGQLIKNHKNIKLNNFDVSDPMKSLKQLEGFMGENVVETEVPFDLDRPLTQEEIDSTVYYCTHDVEQTLKVFEFKKDDFEAQLLLIEMYDLPMDMFNLTKARVSAHILGGVQQHSIDDEFDLVLPTNLKLNKYKYVADWFCNPRNWTYGTDKKKRQLVTTVAGIEHAFGYGGVHSALENYSSTDGYIICCDVASLYPSLMIEYDLLSRMVKDPNKFEEIKNTRIKLKRAKDDKQKALKLVINSTYGILKDRNSSLYDPRMSSMVCMYGQLFLLDLIEQLEPYGKLIQSNTDGVYFKVDNKETIEKMKEVAHEWEVRTKLELEWDVCTKIFQRDVNNYALVMENGKVKCKGCLKKKTPIDNDLPIIQKAVVDYLVNEIPIENTINNCDDLIMFQKVTKINRGYTKVLLGDEISSEKVNRVFASNDPNAPTIYKVKGEDKIEKIAGTPEHVFVDNGNIINKKCPKELDKQWYIKQAIDMANTFIGDGVIYDNKETNESKLINIINKNHDSLYDVFVDIKTNTRINSKKLEQYIKIDVFKEYGMCGKVLKYKDLFKLLYDKKSIKGDKLPDYFDRNVLLKYSQYNESKNTYSKMDSEKILKEIFITIKDTDIPIYEKVKEEFTLFDDCTLYDPTIEDDLLFIMNVNMTKNPSIIAYNLKYGRTQFLKINKVIFNILELKQYDLVKAIKYDLIPKPIITDKTEEGINIVGEHPTDKEWFLTQYEVLIRDYKNNKMIIEEEVE